MRVRNCYSFGTFCLISRFSGTLRRVELMGLFSKDIQNMDDLLLHGLQDIYYAENQIVKSLPKLIDKATNRDLTKGLQNHLGNQEPDRSSRSGVQEARPSAEGSEVPGY